MSILRFRFDSIAQNKNVESAEIFRFTTKSRDFCQVERSDTILILETLDWIPIKCFSVKQHGFQDNCINHLRRLRKSFFLIFWQGFQN